MRRQERVGDRLDVKRWATSRPRRNVVGQEGHETHLRGNPSNAILLAYLCSHVQRML